MQQHRQGRGASATRRLVLCAVFAALAYAAMAVFRLKVQFLTFDLKDAVITIAGLLLGPVAAVVLSLLVAVLEFITASDTGLYGFIMNFASSAAFSLVASVVYKYRKRLSGAVIGLCAAVVSLVAVMMVLNLLVTPLYTGMTVADVAGMIPVLLLPFNAIKALSNAALVLVLYKPISRAVQASGLLPRGQAAAPAADGAAVPDRRRISLTVTLVGLALLVAAVLVFFLVLDGHFELF